MSSLIRSPKDFCAALIYLTFGLGAIYLGQELPMGTALKMGPAYFPAVLGWALSFIGLISLIRSFLRKGGPIPAFAWKPLLLIVGAVAGLWLALLETVSAKLRVFRAPEFMATAFMFAVLGLLVHLLLGA